MHVDWLALHVFEVCTSTDMASWQQSTIPLKTELVATAAAAVSDCRSPEK